MLNIKYVHLSIPNVFSQSFNTTNPVLIHTRDVWVRIHKTFKLSHYLQKFSSLWHNPAIRIGKKMIYWKYWHQQGISIIDYLYENGVLRSYENLKKCYNLLGKENFWKFLQPCNCIRSKVCPMVDNPISRYLEKTHESHKSSQLYKMVNSYRSSDLGNLRTIWQRDIGEEIDPETWSSILVGCGKYIKEARGKLTQYKILHRYYHTPVRLTG